MATGTPMLEKKESITCHMWGITGEHGADPHLPSYLSRDILGGLKS